MKKTFCVTLNWHGEVHQFYTKASRPDLAVQNAISRVAIKLGRSRYSTNLHFQNGDKILVREVKFEKEKEKTK